MTLALPVYPDNTILPGLGFHTKWAPKYFNLGATAASGADIDLSLAQYPLHEFELIYNYLRDWGPSGPYGIAQTASLEFKTLFGFFTQLKGSAGRFLFRNPDDNQVWQQNIGTGDGVTTAFTLSRFFGARGYGASEPVGAVDTAKSFNVYVDGQLNDASLYTIDTSTGCAQQLLLKSAPAAAKSVTVDMSYFYYCKFSDDSASFEKAMQRLWLLQSLKIKSCRPGA